MPQKDEVSRNVFIRLILKHTIFSLAVTIILLALAALMIAGGLIPIGQSLGAVLFAEAVGTFAGGLRISGRVQGHKLPTAALTGLCVFIVLLIAGFLFSFPPARHGLFILIAAIVPAALGSLAAARRSTRRTVR